MSITITGNVTLGSISVSSPLPAIGTATEGGYIGAYISLTQDGVATHQLIVSPKASGYTTMAFISGSGSLNTIGNKIDGPTNTNTLFAQPSTYIAAAYARNLNIGGYTDWYLPAFYEIEAIYYNLKPNTTNNYVGSIDGINLGVNPYAVPKRTTAWTASGAPLQTSVTSFQTGNSETYAGAPFPQWHVTSNSSSGSLIFMNLEAGGFSGFSGGTSTFPVRAIRRVAL
jgi:hypothetical protein